MSEYFLPILFGSILFALLLVFIGYFIFLHYRTRQKFEWERQQFRQTVLQTEVEIREQTLEHISRELHDNIGHIASLLKINLALLEKDANENNRESISESISLLRQLITDIKSISTSMNTDQVRSLGLWKMLERDAARISRSGILNIILEGEDLTYGLDPDKIVIIYRISQEIMNNVIRHAGADEMKIVSRRSAEGIELVFTDNGRGFDTAAVSGGNGLRNLQKRARMISGTIVLLSSPGKGTEIKLTLRT